MNFFLKQNILFFQPKNVNNRDVSTLVYIEAFIDTSLLVDTLTCSLIDFTMSSLL